MTARSLFSQLVEQDWDIDNEIEAETNMHQVLNKLGDIRESHKLPRVCA